MTGILSWVTPIMRAAAVVTLLAAPAAAIAQDGEEVVQQSGPVRNYGPSAPPNIGEFGPPPGYRTPEEIAARQPSPPPARAATPQPRTIAAPPVVSPTEEADTGPDDGTDLAPDTQGRPPAEWEGNRRPAPVAPHPDAIAEGEGSRPAAASITLRGMANVLLDGQSLVVRGQPVRLDKIHAPRADALCHRGYAYSWNCGQRSRDALAALLAELPVTCRGRIWSGNALVARCVRRDGLDVASALVRQGMAVVNRQYFKDYMEEEIHARDNGLGMWAGSFDPPWQN